jgi:hypothetical protein
MVGLYPQPISESRPNSFVLLVGNIKLLSIRSRITKVTFTPIGGQSSIQLVVWQFWGRAAEAS